MCPNKAESQTVEFKEGWRDENLKSLCAFANSEGGQLVIGVDNNGNAIGIKNPKKLDSIKIVDRNFLLLFLSFFKRFF
ncbi:MAG: ATP-binding protein [Deltaproteobacteria bacterium]|nr:ATP-binding protein [Deltaproteobacteria bacterium]